MIDETPLGLTKKLQATTDAAVWAEEFIKIVKTYDSANPTDFGFMVGWFANAIEVAKDAAARRERLYQAAVDKVVEDMRKAVVGPSGAFRLYIRDWIVRLEGLK